MFIYNIKYLFERKHYNPPYNEDYHSHQFIVNFELTGNVRSDNMINEYEIDTVEFQKQIGRFVYTLNEHLNEDERLSSTDCSTESMCLMFTKEFPRFLKKQGYLSIYDITILSVSVFEGPYRETKLIVNKSL